MLTYIGRGYSPGFSANMTRLLRLMARGRLVRIGGGPDDICAGNRGSAAGRHCRSASVRTRDALAAQDLQRLRFVPTPRGTVLRLTPALLARMRTAFARGASRGACAGCAWKRLCDRVAARGFAGCVLLPRALTAQMRAANF